MIPGLWLEIEVMGIKCPLVDTVCDDSWFSHATARESMTEAVISLISETQKSVHTLTR